VLAQLNWAAALTRDGVARTDVLAVNSIDGRMVTVQVKTTWCNPGQLAKWQLGLKDVLPAVAPSEWYVMVKLEGSAPARCRYFVVPRDHLAAAAWIVHQNWLTNPNVPAGTRNTQQSRAIVDETVFAGYEDTWDTLDTSTDLVPVRLPSWCRERALEERVGLPPDHPWRRSLPDW
jgi:hypothetical protein